MARVFRDEPETTWDLRWGSTTDLLGLEAGDECRVGVTLLAPDNQTSINLAVRAYADSEMIGEWSATATGDNEWETVTLEFTVPVTADGLIIALGQILGSPTLDNDIFYFDNLTLEKYQESTTTASGAIRMLAEVVSAKEVDSYEGTDEDDFERDNTRDGDPDDEGKGLGSGWEVAIWAEDGGHEIKDGTAWCQGKQNRGNIRHALNFAPAQGYSIQADIVMREGNDIDDDKWLVLMLDDDIPDITLDGVEIELHLIRLSGNTLSYTGQLTDIVDGDDASSTDFPGGTVTPPFTLKAVVLSNNIKVYLNDTEVADVNVTAHAGTRVGIDSYRYQHTFKSSPLSWDNWYATGVLVSGVAAERETRLVAAAAGEIFHETPPGSLVQVTGDSAQVSDQHPIMAQAQGQKLYIADYDPHRVTGTDGTIGGAGKDELTATGVSDWTAHDIDADTDVVVIYEPEDPGPTAGTYKITSVAAGKVTLAMSLVTAGTCSYRIERAPKVYDPAAETVTIWTADLAKGSVPTGCSLICLYRNRLVMAGAAHDLQNWFMSRQGDPDDWDYSETDVQAAIAGNTADAGLLGERVTALIPYSDDYLILGGVSTMWLMRGDPSAGGVIDNISYEVGVLDKRAWCHDPQGIVYWLGVNGLYRLAVGSPPENLSAQSLPAALKNINTELVDVQLVYDPYQIGIFIFLTAKAEEESTHYFYDLRTGGFFRDRLPIAQGPTAVLNYHADSSRYRALLLGGRDGVVRAYHPDAMDDDGTAITSRVTYTPQRIAGVDGYDGILTNLQAVLDEQNQRVTLEVLSGATHEAAVRAAVRASRTYKTGGIQNPMRERIRGGSVALRLRNSAAGTTWAIETIYGEVMRGGRTRL